MVQALGPAGAQPPAQGGGGPGVRHRRAASAGLYTNLAVLAYAAGQSRKGDLASEKAVELAPKDQKSLLKEQLQQAKTQARLDSPTTTQPRRLDFQRPRAVSSIGRAGDS